MKNGGFTYSLHGRSGSGSKAQKTTNSQSLFYYPAGQVHGIDGILRAYRRSLQVVHMHGPSCPGDVLELGSYYAKNYMQEPEKEGGVLRSNVPPDMNYFAGSPAADEDDEDQDQDQDDYDHDGDDGVACRDGSDVDTDDDDVAEKDRYGNDHLGDCNSEAHAKDFEKTKKDTVMSKKAVRRVARFVKFSECASFLGALAFMVSEWKDVALDVVHSEEWRSQNGSDLAAHLLAPAPAKPPPTWELFPFNQHKEGTADAHCERQPGQESSAMTSSLDVDATDDSSMMDGEERGLYGCPPWLSCGARDLWMALLVLQKGSEGGPPKALLADSLKADGAPAACANELKDLLADVDKVPLTATLRWPRPLTTAVMVECLSLRRGEGSKQRGSQHSLVAELKTKLSTFTSQRKAEAEKLLEEKEEFLVDQAVQLKTASDKVQLLAKQASAAKGELSALQKAALKVVKEGAPPDVSDLGKEALLDSERIKTLGDPRVCSRCARFLRTAAFLMPGISCFNNSEFAQDGLVDLAGSRFPTNTSFAPVPWWAAVLSNRQEDEPPEGDSLSPLTVSLRKDARDLADAAGELALLGGDLLRNCPSRQELLLLRRDLMFWWDQHRFHGKWGKVRTAFDGTVRAIERCRKLQRPRAVVQLHIPKTAGSAMKDWAETTGFRVLEQTQQIKQGDGPYWIGTAGLPGSCRQRTRENRDRNTTWVAVERWLDLWPVDWLELWMGMSSNYQVRSLAGKGGGAAYLERGELAARRLAAAKRVLAEFDVVLSVGRGGVDRSQEDTRAMRLPEEPEVGYENDPEGLVKATLAELPQEIVMYYRMLGVKPRGLERFENKYGESHPVSLPRVAKGEFGLAQQRTVDRQAREKVQSSQSKLSSDTGGSGSDRLGSKSASQSQNLEGTSDDLSLQNSQSMSLTLNPYESEDNLEDSRQMDLSSSSEEERPKAKKGGDEDEHLPTFLLEARRKG
eukprot:s4080_g4.t1